MADNIIYVINLKKTCRLCLINDSEIDLNTVYKSGGIPYSSLASMLMEMELLENDTFSNRICDECASKLILFYKFKQKCETSNRTLMELIRKSEESTVPEVVNDSNNEIKSEGTLRIEIENISKFTENMYSAKTMIQNLPWNIFITPQKNIDREDYVGFFVQCNVDRSEAWSCKASLVYRIMSFDPKVVPHFEKTVLKHIFDHKENDWGFKLFISKQQLTDPQNCFVKDGRVVFEAQVVADMPQGSDSSSKKLSSYVGHKTEVGHLQLKWGYQNSGASCYPKNNELK